MNNLNHYNELELPAFLDNFMHQEVDFLPNWGNIGDMLIYGATLQLFNQRDININLVSGPQDCRNKVLFVSGGGNLIEEYSSLLSSLTAVSKFYPLIYVLPSTIFGSRASAFFSQTGENVFIFCRERNSYDFLRKACPHTNNFYLSKDIAFYYNYESYKKEGAGVLKAFRGDLEKTKIRIPHNNLDISQDLRIRDKPFKFDFWTTDYWGEYLNLFMQIISEHQEINTNRLHVGIAATMLGKRVKLYSNSYFKNRAVFEYSLSKFENVKWSRDTPLLFEQFRYLFR